MTSTEEAGDQRAVERLQALSTNLPQIQALGLTIDEGIKGGLIADFNNLGELTSLERVPHNPDELTPEESAAQAAEYAAAHDVPQSIVDAVGALYIDRHTKQYVKYAASRGIPKDLGHNNTPTSLKLIIENAHTASVIELKLGGVLSGLAEWKEDAIVRYDFLGLPVHFIDITDIYSVFVIVGIVNGQLVTTVALEYPGHTALYTSSVAAM